MGDESEWAKLPTEDKVVHTAWKARLTGYEEATKLFQRLDEKSPEFSKYLGLMKKFVLDNNAIAQEKALDAVLAFLETAHIAGKTAGEVCSGVVNKCLNASRAKTKEKGMEILLMYIEIEKQEIVQEVLMTGLTNKQPKIVAGCVMVLRMALRDFGSKIIQLKPIVKNLQKLLEDRDKNVREESKQLVVEMYRWIGQALKPQLTNLKPVQISELEAEFESLPQTRPQQARFLRSQQDLKAKMEEQAAAGGDGVVAGDDDGADPVDIDPYDLMEPVDILTKLPKDFYEKIEAKKWQERREVLDLAQKLSENPKLAAGDYGDLVRAVKKVVGKDTNVMLVALAGKCLTGLATGLRKKFSPYAVACIETIIEKFKEKKPMVVTALREAIDACYVCTTLENICEQTVEAMGNKNPSIKAETVSFLARCFTRCTPSILNKKMLKLYCPNLMKTVNDTVPDVREASFTALGTLLKILGEKHMGQYLADVDPIKMAKIKECSEKVELVGRGGKAEGGGGGGGSAGGATAAPPKTASGRPTIVKKEPPKSKIGGDGDRPKTGPPKIRGGKKGGAGPAKGKKAAGSGGASKEESAESILSDESVEEKAAAVLPADVLTGLASANWKERLAAMEKFTQLINGMVKSDVPVQVCVRTINKKPGIKDTNFQVLKFKVELIALLGKECRFTKTSAGFCLAELVDKVGDVKNGAAVQEALSCIAESCSLEYVSLEVIKLAFDQKNPKNQSEALNWLSGAIKEFGMKVNIKALIVYLKKAFAATNPAVRNAAIGLLATVYMYMGPTARVFFEGEKAALLQQIDAEFEKVKDEKPPAPTRGVKSREEEDSGEVEEEEEAEEGINVADLVPRNDISNQITPELITEMGDKSWKIRAEGLQKVTSILNEAKFITANIGPLPEALKARLGDSNKNLVTTSVTLCHTLATAMGPSVKKHVAVIGPGLLNCLGDSKVAIRQSAMAALNAWVEQAGMVPFVEAELLTDALNTENPNLRAELLGWMAEKLPNYKKLPVELNACIPRIFMCLEDRNGGVRQKAQEVLVPFMVHSGFDPMARQAGKLKPASKDQVMALLDKARENLPAKPVKTKAKAAPVEPAKTEPKVEVKDEPSEPSSAPSSRPGSSAARSRGKAPPKKATNNNNKKNKEEDTSPPIVANNSKEQRIKEEKQMKVLKWNFTAPRLEFTEQLHAQMEAGFSKTVLDQLFHTDFKQHIKAIDTLNKSCENSIDATIAQLDVILKWMTLRFFDTNPSVLMLGLKYLQTVFGMLSSEDYHLQEFEASAFVPYLVGKVGDPKDNIRRDIRAIFKLIYKVYPASKMFSYIVDGLKSKNAKQRTECLDELGNLIEIYGMNVCQPSPAQALKIIAQQIGDRDNNVRSAALNTVVTAYHILGETVYKYVGNLSDKDMGLLEERIKRSSKNRSAAPPPRASPEEKPKVPRNTQGVQHREHDSDERPPRPRSFAKKEFVLELDDAENQTLHDGMPQLVQHDLDEILDEPVKLPETRMRPPSPSVKLLNSSNDASSAIDLVISQIASKDITTSIQALAQIDEVLKDEEKRTLMASHVDQFLVACALQLRVSYSKHMDNDNHKDNVVRLYRCILASLLALFQVGELAVEPSKEVIKDLIYNLITILIDNRLNQLEEGPQVVRSVNVMVVKIVEKADRTNVMSALIKLLHDCVASETCSTQFLDLIMKCLWKMVRMLPNMINDLNVDRIIGDLHHFLRAFPGHSWRSRPNDTPLRTIKTILHSLAKLKGNKIMSHLSMIDNPQNSEVEQYLQKVLRNGLDTVASTNTRNEQMNGTEVELRSAKKDSSSKSKRLSKSTHDMLAEIFKKIGSKENTREGLNDLYDFKSKYPEADLEPFLKKSSQFFQNYIERGLKNIQMEREEKVKHGSRPNSMTESSSSGSLNSMSTSHDSDLNPAVYMERLKVLRARCGLDNSQYDGSDGPQQPAMVKLEKTGTASSNSSLSSSSSSGLPQLGSSVSNVHGRSGADPMDSDLMASAANVADLKKRLERIKNATK